MNLGAGYSGTLFSQLSPVGYKIQKGKNFRSTIYTLYSMYCIYHWQDFGGPWGGEQVERVGLAEVGRARLTAEAVQNSILLPFVVSLVFLFLMSLVHIFVLVEFN